MRLIDADEAEKLLTELRMTIHDTGNVYGISGTIVESVRPCVASGVRAAQANLKRMPTVEAEPVRHGRWIPIDGEPYTKCSYCGEKHYGCTTPYCDMCGTYMREESGDADN